MTKTTHTPGPWVVNSGMVETATGVPIAHMDRKPANGTMPVERDCNAYLCAASPAMLTALEDCVKSLERLPDVDGAYRVTCIQQVKEAIKLARKND